MIFDKHSLAEQIKKDHMIASADSRKLRGQLSRRAYPAKHKPL